MRFGKRTVTMDASNVPDQAPSSVVSWEPQWETERLLVSLLHHPCLADKASLAFLEVPVLDDEHFVWAKQWINLADLRAQRGWAHVAVITRTEPGFEKRNSFDDTSVRVTSPEYWVLEPRERLLWLIKDIWK